MADKYNKKKKIYGLIIIAFMFSIIAYAQAGNIGLATCGN